MRFGSPKRAETKPQVTRAYLCPPNLCRTYGKPYNSILLSGLDVSLQRTSASIKNRCRIYGKPYNPALLRGLDLSLRLKPADYRSSSPPSECLQSRWKTIRFGFPERAGSKPPTKICQITGVHRRHQNPCRF